MRSALVSLALGLPLLSAPACVNEEPLPPYVSVEYQVRCLGECFNSPDEPVRALFAVDGEDDLRVRCRVGQSGGKRVMTFSAECPGGSGLGCGSTRYKFEVTGLAVNNSDGDPGDTCKVSVREGSNTYESGCTGGSLTANNRCRMDFNVDKDDSEVTGTLRCTEMPNAAQPTITRYLVAPGGESSFKFVAQGCEGL